MKTSKASSTRRSFCYSSGAAQMASCCTSASWGLCQRAGDLTKIDFSTRKTTKRIRAMRSTRSDTSRRMTKERRWLQESMFARLSCLRPSELHNSNTRIKTQRIERESSNSTWKTMLIAGLKSKMSNGLKRALATVSFRNLQTIGLRKLLIIMEGTQLHLKILSPTAEKHSRSMRKMSASASEKSLLTWALSVIES